MNRHPSTPALREKALASMIHERGRHVEKPRGHREWLVAMPERKARA